MNYRIVRVTWRDPCAISAWTKVGTPSEPEICISIGFLVEDWPDYVVVASTVGADEYNAAMRIERSCMEGISEIREASRG